MVRSSRPTIKDVAKHVGVSFKTVSRVINGQPGVRPEVRARVRAAITELGYVVNHSARLLASGSSRTLGVVIPRITDPYTFQMIHHVGTVSEAAGLGVIILTRPTLTDEISISNFIGHGLVGSLLFVAPRSTEPYLPIIRTLGLPAVVMETQFLGDAQQPAMPIPCVASDNRHGAFAGVSYLAGLGHTRIATITGGEAPQARLRLLGYEDALAAHGLQSNAAYVRHGRFTWESGYDQALALLDATPRPTAIFCASDAMALGAIRACHERGLRVPGDMSILGFDDIPDAAASAPPLTTVRQQAFAMARHAIQLLQRAMEGEETPPGTHLYPTELVIRASCASPA
ncbi:MAG TPA: LacI family transcriptional regulator [Chloroflexi bacterium]|nr:LacI family transcriptional regulator [Chloroflexota bacterium]